MKSALKKIYKKAKAENFAVGAFNTSNLEITQAIAEAAEEMNSPIIIQTTPNAIEYAGLEQIFDIIKNEIDNRKISGVIHLDHAKDFGIVKKCIEIGYNSIMVDGSILDYENNISLTRKVANFAHDFDVFVEGELGRISKSDEGKIQGKTEYTDPLEILDFITKTKIDSLAVSVGNEHGAPKNEKVNFKLLREICEISTVPIVLHGSSGLSRRDIAEAIRIGVVKFNIDTAIRKVFVKNISKSNNSSKEPREILSDTKEAIKNLVKEYILLFGSKDKA